MQPIIQCWKCKHYRGPAGGETCAAFPDEIPDAILMYEHDHRKPYPGDNGIRFEAVEDEEADATDA